MKKKISLILLILLFNCQKKMEQIKWYNTGDFSKFEEKSTIKCDEAIKIYEQNFEENFKINVNVLKDPTFSRENKQIIYIYDKYYYIGYRSLLDKRGDEDVLLKFSAKINSETGEISVVK